MVAQNIRCIVKESSLGWWEICRAEHDGREWEEPIPGGHRSMCSYRLGEGDNNADIEGTPEEMWALAQAIESGGRVSFKRCSVNVTEEGVELTNPSIMRESVTITHQCAAELAADIRSKVMVDDSPLPEEIKVDGLQAGEIELWGKATKLPDGRYQCLANVDGRLCVVVINITSKD